MLRDKLLESLKTWHDIDEKTSKESTINKLLKTYPKPLSLSEEKSPLAKLYIEFHQLLQILQKEKAARHDIQAKITHLGFAKNLALENNVIIPKALHGFLQDLEAITKQASEAYFSIPLCL